MENETPASEIPEISSWKEHAHLYSPPTLRLGLETGNYGNNKEGNQCFHSL